MKNETKKIIATVGGIVVGTSIALTVLGCKDQPDNPPIIQEDLAKDQSAIITDLFGDSGRSATVKGHFTNAEWNGVAGKIETAINDRYNYYESINANVLKARWETVFGRGVIIIVEKAPSGYIKWKTTTDGKTMYLGYGELDNSLQETLGTAVMNMESNTADFAKAIAPTHDKGWQRLNREAIQIANTKTRVAKSHGIA